MNKHKILVRNFFHVTEDMAEGFVIPLVWQLLRQGISETWRSAELWVMSGIPPCMKLLTEVSFDHLYFYFSSRLVSSSGHKYSFPASGC